MSKMLLVKYGELALKGKNKKIFVNRVINNTKNVLKEETFKIIKEWNRFIIKFKDDETALNAIPKVRNIFGLSSVSIVDECKSNKGDISKLALAHVENLLSKSDHKTFRITVKRAWKKFPMESPELACEIGGDVLDRFPHLKVDLKNPEFTVFIEILEGFSMVYTEKFPCLRGLPVGTSGKVGLFLSGGIDSPVAGYLAQKRGCYLNCIYFHSPPHTSEKAKQKVIKLAEKLNKYQGKIRLFVVNFTETQITFKKNTKEEYFVVLGRRMMMRIANELAKEYKFKAFITGENLGQVASQTLENLDCVNSIAKVPVLRPLITYDKDETIEIAHKIDTFETSILPYDDCCTLFLPPNPNTKAKKKYLEIEEKKVNIEEIVKKAVDTVEIIDL